MSYPVHQHHPVPIIVNLTNSDDPPDFISKQVDYMKSDSQFVVTHFILECGKKLEADSVTICTAACLFNKFYSATTMSDYDPYLIAGTCLYLAGKVEDNHLKLRDVINIVQSVLHRSLDPLPLGDQYWNTRDAMVQAELLVLRMCQFSVKFAHPHKHLLHYLKSLRDWMSSDVWAKYPIARTSWALLQDLYHDPRVLDTEPSVTALGCIQLALETFGIQIPFVGSTEGEKGSLVWYKVVNDKCSKEKLWEVMTRVMEVYNRESELLNPITIESAPR